MGRIARVTAAGWQYEDDRRHGELAVEGLNLSTAKGVMTPGEDGEMWEHDEDELLRGADVSNYRALAARANLPRPRSSGHAVLGQSGVPRYGFASGGPVEATAPPSAIFDLGAEGWE